MLISVLVLLFYFADMGQGACPIQTESCISVQNNSCISQFKNGSGKTWIEMNNNCSSSGRLLWLSHIFTETNLYVSVLSKVKNGSSQTVSTGLMMSIKGDSRIFWTTPAENISYTCGLDNTSLCLESPADKNTCLAVGCCWTNGACQFPDQQQVAEYNGTATLDTSTVTVNQTTRRCVGLQKRNSSWTLIPYNCSEPTQADNGFVCEYKCGSVWPDVDLQNVTWPRTSSTTTVKTSSTTSHTSTSPTTLAASTTDGPNQTTYTSDNGKYTTSTLPAHAITGNEFGRGDSGAGSIFDCQIILTTLMAPVLHQQRWI